jgi:hypothetical protein
MALPTDSDPCSILNSAGLPTIWLNPTTDYNTAFPNIFSSGNLIKYKVAIASASTTVPVLATPSPTSSYRLIQFLSGGGVASASGSTGTTVGGVKLPKTIVNDYFEIAKGAAYTYSTPETPIMSDSDINSVRDQLVVDGYLLSSTELFDPAQFGASASITANRECLVYLYAVEENVNKQLTPEQAVRKSLLEVRNLKFFGSFLMEYCFYRTRYDILLKQYFTLYTQASTTTVSASLSVFGTGAPTPASNPYSQSDYLSGLAFHMACINTRLTDMRRLLSSITSYYQGIFTQIQTAINSSNIPGSNQELTNTILALNDSAKDIQAYMTESDFKKGVMEYNSQKNRYANVLLALYAFLNIAAIATVMQIAQS